MYQCRCRGLPAGLSDGLFDPVTAAYVHSPPSHPTPTDEQRQRQDTEVNMRELLRLLILQDVTACSHTFGPGSMSFCLILTVVSMKPEQLPMSSG